MESFFAEVKVFRFGRKAGTIIVRRFDRNRGHFLCTHNSSLESATKLKFAPLCSSRDALSYGCYLMIVLCIHFVVKMVSYNCNVEKKKR